MLGFILFLSVTEWSTDCNNLFSFIIMGIFNSVIEWSTDCNNLFSIIIMGILVIVNRESKLDFVSLNEKTLFLIRYNHTHIQCNHYFI